nr:MAG TPA: hypothetical protein [Crassvirales sp.]
MEHVPKQYLNSRGIEKRGNVTHNIVMLKVRKTLQKVIDGWY